MLLVCGGCGTVADLRYTSPFKDWIGQSYPASTELNLYPHHSGLAKGEASFRLTEHKRDNEAPRASFTVGTEFLVDQVQLRSRIIGSPHIYVKVAVPTDDGTVIADVELFQEPYPLVLDWPNQALQWTGDARGYD